MRKIMKNFDNIKNKKCNPDFQGTKILGALIKGFDK